jgi:hypothetical protein
MDARKRLLIVLTTVLVIGGISTSAMGAPPSGDVPWQTGIRALGTDVTIEPAVNDVTGTQTFLLTPTNSPFYSGPGPVPAPFRNVSAPLYLVTYPLGSTADASAPFNCYTEGYFDPTLPYNCDHAQIKGIKGHDHLVGVPGSSKAPIGGDFNVQWHVLATFFTQKGITDGAMNHRIMTLEQLQQAQANGDVGPFVDTGIYFDCSVVSSHPYMNGTPLSFTPGG